MLNGQLSLRSGHRADRPAGSKYLIAQDADLIRQRLHNTGSFPTQGGVVQGDHGVVDHAHLDAFDGNIPCKHTQLDGGIEGHVGLDACRKLLIELLGLAQQHREVRGIEHLVADAQDHFLLAPGAAHISFIALTVAGIGQGTLAV